jgi:hypothetical protein
MVYSYLPWSWSKANKAVTGHRATKLVFNLLPIHCMPIPGLPWNGNVVRELTHTFYV